jgi:hypothetical protein
MHQIMASVLMQLFPRTEAETGQGSVFVSVGKRPHSERTPDPDEDKDEDEVKRSKLEVEESVLREI